jgi:hypothetical protein
MQRSISRGDNGGMDVHPPPGLIAGLLLLAVALAIVFYVAATSIHTP